jgi:hypothetical protein
MALNLNPMSINGPSSSGNYQQSDYRIPSAVATSPSGANMLNLTWPIPAYTQPNLSTNVTTTQLTGGPLGISNNPWGAVSMATAQILQPARRRGRPKNGQPAAFSEAASFVALLNRGEETPTNIRKHIGTATPERCRILRAFDLLLIERKLSDIPNETRSRVLALLPTQSERDVAKACGISRRKVRKIAAICGGTGRIRTTGRGRRVPKQLAELIIDSLRVGVSQAEIQRDTGVGLITIAKLRKQIRITPEPLRAGAWGKKTSVFRLPTKD